jgi:hypothetical protein
MSVVLRRLLVWLSDCARHLDQRDKPDTRALRRLTLQKPLDECLYSNRNARLSQSLGFYDGDDLFVGALQIVVDHHVIVLGPSFDFTTRVVEPRGDGCRGILSAPVKPRSQFLHRRRQDKNAHDIGAQSIAHLLRALPVDIEEHVPALR